MFAFYLVELFSPGYAKYVLLGEKLANESTQREGENVRSQLMGLYICIFERGDFIL